MAESRNYLIIGGTSGIGKALVNKLLENTDHRVTVLSRNADSSADRDRLRHVRGDATSNELPADALPDILHGLAYCPGSINLKPFRSLGIDQFQEDFDINVLGAVRVLQATHKALRKSRTGSVVFFSTVAVQTGMPYHASVAAAKGAVEGLTRSLAAEFAPHIRFNCLAPSLTDTPLAERLLATDDKREASAKRHPLQRVGRPEDIAELAAYLLSDKSSWITGQVIGIDGGLGSLKT